MLISHRQVNIWILLLMLFCFFPAMAHGEEETESGTWKFFQETWSPRLDMQIMVAYYCKGPQDAFLKPEDWNLNGSFTAGLTRSFSNGLMLRIDPKFNYDPFFAEGVQLLIEDRKNRPALTLNEVLLSWYGDSTEIEVGKKIYSWKVADGFSPIDTLNPVDTIVAINPEKIGVPSVSASKLFDSANIQVVFLPFFMPDRLPNETNRWTVEAPELRAKFEKEFGMAPETVDAGRALPENKLDKMSIASRISSSTLLSGWDLALIYRYGYSTLGVIRNDIDLAYLPLVYQTTEYPAYSLYGLSFATVSGDIELHGETAFHDTRDNFKDEDYLSYILGINYTNYELLSQWFERISLAAEYAGEEIIKKRDANSNYSNMGVGRGLTDNIIGSIDFKINADHSFKTACTYNFTDRDSMLDLKGVSRLNNHLEMAYGYQVLSGSAASFFGQWDNNDRIYIEMGIKY